MAEHSTSVRPTTGTRRIVTRQAVFLILAVALLVLAARNIHGRARAQAIEQAGRQQAMLAEQTARGIESYYASIIETLDLLRRSDTESDTPSTEPPAAITPEPPPAGAPRPREPPDTVPRRPGILPRILSAGPHERPGDLPPRSPRDATGGLSGPALERVLESRLAAGPAAAAAQRALLPVFWDQLRGRVSQLFVVDRQTLRVLARYAEPDAMPADGIVESRRAWLAGITEATVSKAGEYDGRVGNIVVVPTPGNRRLLCAIVPMAYLERRFLTATASEDDATATMLLDESGRILSIGEPELVGKSMVDDVPDPRLRQLALETLGAGRAVTRAYDAPTRVGDRTLAPSLVSLHPVKVGHAQWWVGVASDLERVDSVVGGIFRGVLLWGTVFGGAFTLLFTRIAIGQIRERARVEKVKSDLLRTELEQARRIQLAWLPDATGPRPAGLDLSAVNRAANHISGDFYNWFELPDGRACVVIGDVTGHGMSAAFLMATTQLLIRAAMIRLGDPGPALEAVNRELCQQMFNGQFVTLVILVIDPNSGRVLVANAGHPPPVVARGAGRVELLDVEPQLVAGVQADWEYPTQSFDLDGATSLLLYTDGVPDAPAATGDDRFDTEGILRCLAEGRVESAAAMIDCVVVGVDRFRGPRDLSDDVTIVAVRIIRDGSPPRAATVASRVAAAAM